MPPSSAKPLPTDGRKARSANSRQAIVEAMLELARDGEVDPSAELVADRAGVGRRTVFRLFQEMESLYASMHGLMESRIDHIRSIPIEGATWRERLDSLISRRAKLFEEILPIKVASDVHRHRSPFLQKAHAEVGKTLRHMLLFVLPKSVINDAELFEALDAALSIETWQRMRRDQKLSAKTAQRVLERTVAALVD